MRKLLVSLALSALPLVTLPAASLGATAITSFKAKAVPIPKPGGGVFAHTGNCLGCGAAVEAEYRSEERRVGKECRSRGGREQEKERERRRSTYERRDKR